MFAVASELVSAPVDVSDAHYGLSGRCGDSRHQSNDSCDCLVAMVFACRISARELVTNARKSCNLCKVWRVKSVSLDRGNLLPDSESDHFHLHANSPISLALGTEGKRSECWRG
jgi:hypothetical protein